MIANSTSGICPFTLKSLASTRPEDVAVIYANNPLNSVEKKTNYVMVHRHKKRFNVDTHVHYPLV